MVESERTTVLYRRVNMFYILPLSVIHWRAAPSRPSTRPPSHPARRVASLSEMPSFNKTYIFPSEENTGETRNLFFHFMLVYKTKVEHFRNIMLITQLCILCVHGFVVIRVYLMYEYRDVRLSRGFAE